MSEITAAIAWNDQLLNHHPEMDATHREFVDHLAQVRPLSAAQRSAITAFLADPADLDDLMVRTVRVLTRLTGQVADALMRKLDPRGVIVVIEAQHLCMAMRGIRKPGASTTTSAVRGQFKTDNASRSEALDLILRK